MLTILHTNDYHNHLPPAQSARLRALRRSIGENGLLLDAGDAIGAGNITFRPGGEPILDTMENIGYDAMTVGNREFHFSRIGFRSKLCRASFPILCANLRSSGKITPEDDESGLSRNPAAVTSTVDPPVLPYIVRDLPIGWRLVVFGITVPMITERMLVRKVSAYLFDNPLDTAASLVPTLRSQYAPDLLVALTHIGIQQDRLLASKVSGIDLIVGGHSHVVLDKGERVGGTLIVQAGCKGQYVGRVLVEKSEHGLHLTASLEAL